MKFKNLVIDKPEDLIFGSAPYPVTTKRGLVIGGGTVYPELNFTLPPISIKEENIAKFHNLGISNRFSPGYCNWDVSEQHLLFQLSPENACGISLNDSALMTPIKSVTGVLGIGNGIERKEYKCSFGSKIDCIMRTNK